MQLHNMPNLWIVIGAGVAIWFMGQKLRGNGSIGERLSKFVSFVGFAVFALGMYAGFRGPLTIGGITIGTFPFSRMMNQASAEAMTYERSNLNVSCTPAVSWGKAAKKTLQFNVKNNGDREVGHIVVRLAATDGSFFDLSMNGPFPAKKTTVLIENIPSQVSRSYFDNSRVTSCEVVSARF